MLRHTLWVLAFSLTAIVLSFYFLDSELAAYFKTPELESVYYYSRELTNIGLSVHYFVLAIAGVVLSRWVFPRVNYFKTRVSASLNSRINQWSLQLLKSLVVIGIALPIFKFIVGRQRPHLTPDFNSRLFNPFTFDWHWHSFPSGHAQVVFTVATLAFLIWPRQKYLFLFMAAALALTRVTIQQHFLSDIIAGATLGYLGTLWLYKLWPPQFKGELS